MMVNRAGKFAYFTRFQESTVHFKIRFSHGKGKPSSALSFLQHHVFSHRMNKEWGREAPGLPFWPFFMPAKNFQVLLEGRANVRNGERLASLPIWRDPVRVLWVISAVAHRWQLTTPPLANSGNYKLVRKKKTVHS